MNMKKKTGKKLKIALLSFLLIFVFLFGGMAITFASITKNAVLDSNLLPKQNVSTAFYDINGNKTVNELNPMEIKWLSK